MNRKIIMSLACLIAALSATAHTALGEGDGFYTWTIDGTSVELKFIDAEEQFAYMKDRAGTMHKIAAHRFSRGDGLQILRWLEASRNARGATTSRTTYIPASDPGWEPVTVADTVDTREPWEIDWSKAAPPRIDGAKQGREKSVMPWERNWGEVPSDAVQDEWIAEIEDPHEQERRAEQQSIAAHIQASKYHIAAMMEADPDGAANHALSLGAIAHGAGLDAAGHHLEILGHNIHADPYFDANHSIHSIPAMDDPFFP